MAAEKPVFDPSEFHMLIRGVDGVEFEQGGCYFGPRHNFVKRAPKRQVPPADTSTRTKINLTGPQPDRVVLGKIESAAKENAESLKAEEAVDE
jgi:hypothetical protein